MVVVSSYLQCVVMADGVVQCGLADRVFLIDGSPHLESIFLNSGSETFSVNFCFVHSSVDNDTEKTGFQVKMSCP